MTETFTINSSFMILSKSDFQRNAVSRSLMKDEERFDEYVRSLMNQQLMEPNLKSIEVILEYAQKA